jgi:hypothetical protein
MAYEQLNILAGMAGKVGRWEREGGMMGAAAT